MSAIKTERRHAVLFSPLGVRACTSLTACPSLPSAASHHATQGLVMLTLTSASTALSSPEPQK